DVVAVQLNLIGSHDAPRALTVLGGDVAALRIATLLQAVLPGAPCVYYGDEVGLRGGNDPANRAAFPWDEGRWDTNLRAFVRAVLRLRGTEPALRHGSTTAIGTAGPALALERRLGWDRLVAAVNPGGGEVSLDITLPDAGDGSLTAVPLDAGEAPASVPVSGGRATLTVPGRTACVLRFGTA
ncbi:MAG TPA: alpha-amylase family glycosyl hydrolase, partial [Candidatus Saccharimonadales bacterium]|nr:alpha-amylase family glycosyl hydrolase [Candidatus Saccharimonadales bacterium]